MSNKTSGNDLGFLKNKILYVRKNLKSQRIKNSKIYLIILIGVLITFLDNISSYIILSLGGVEYNPISVYLMNQVGLVQSMILNIPLTLLVLFGLGRLSSELLHERISFYPLLIFCLIRGFLVMNNIKELIIFLLN